MQNVDNSIIFVVFSGCFIVLLLLSLAIFFFIAFNKKLLNKQKENFENILEATEKESQRIGQNLHDDIGPLLASIKLNMNSVLSSSGIESETRAVLEKGVTHLTQVMKTLRDQSHDLTSSVLIQNGLISALEERLDSIHSSGNWNIEFDNKWIPKLSITNSIVLYRILTECFHNTLKHSKGDSIYVNMERCEDLFVVRYRDNGIGNQILQNSVGIGIQGIYSRMQLLNGKTELNRGKWTGFELILSFKIDDIQQKDEK